VSSAPNARRVVHRVLTGFDSGRVQRIGQGLETSGLVGRDLAFARELAFGVVRRRRLLDFALEGWMPRGLPRDPNILCALRMGSYQLAFMDTPPHAAVDEAVRLLRPDKRRVVNAVLRRLAESVVPERPVEGSSVALPDGRFLRLETALPSDTIDQRALIHSLPRFLVRRWTERLGPEAAERICVASVAVPPLHLRRTARADDTWIERLQASGVECERVDGPDLARVRGGSSPFDTSAFRDGWFVAQDPTAVAAGRALGARPGERVIDFCAAPGTKTTLLADAVGPDGEVWAFDPHEARRRSIQDNTERLGQSWVRIVDSSTELPSDVDRVLVDAPCSNTGVLGRRIEVRERIDPEAIATMAKKQTEILSQAARHVRRGGTLVYSTCSLEREENEEVVATLPDEFAVEDEVTSLPVAGEHDGGYFARLVRTA
ncbi:MAG: hypothetical protein KDB80_11915, partial [Planctomycetes bacterium]|nr:hypothetical protein [Planctomycetota bacterium]